MSDPGSQGNSARIASDIAIALNSMARTANGRTKFRDAHAKTNDVVTLLEQLVPSFVDDHVCRFLDVHKQHEPVLRDVAKRVGDGLVLQMRILDPPGEPVVVLERGGAIRLTIRRLPD